MIKKDKKIIEQEIGKCPKCHNISLDYGVFELQDNMGYWNIECCHCGHIGKEWYSLTFTEQT